MGLDELHLRVLSTSSEDLKEKRNAQKGERPGEALKYYILLLSSFKADAERPSLGACGMSTDSSAKFSATDASCQVLLLGNVVCRMAHICA